MGKQLRVAVVTVSTRCSSGHAKDESGPLLCELVTNKNWIVVETVLVTDSKTAIAAVLKELSSSQLKPVDVVLTTGGTGLSPDDQTPEATLSVITRDLPGLSLGMFSTSLQETPFAMLSRAVCGVADKSIIINMPGSVRAVKTCFSVIAPVLEHAVSLVASNTDEVGKTHWQMASPCHHHHHHQSSLYHHHHNHATNGADRRHHGEDRPRQSPYPTVSVETAQETILAYCKPLGPEEVALPTCAPSTGLHRRHAASDLFSLCDVPSFRASIKDGYAVRSEDGAGRRFVAGRIDAGTPACENGSLENGCAVVINTGAKVPDDADAVVQIEDTRFLSGPSASSANGTNILETIEVLVAPKIGQDIRPVGCDLQRGEKLVAAGDRLQPAVVALLIAGGFTKVPVTSLPVVAIMSTGSELITSGTPTGSQVHDSNRPMLMELLASHGFPVIDCGIAKDTMEDHRTKLGKALSVPDVSVVVTTGGVSMGDRDFVKDVLLNDFCATIHFGRVLVKPGKPTVFSTVKRSDGKTVLIFSLPGNPVSSLVTAHLFLLPALRRLSGCSVDAVLPTMQVKMEHDVELDPRPEYHRVSLRSEPSSAILLATSTNVRRQASSRIASATGGTSLDSSPPLMLGVVALPPYANDRKIVTAGTVLAFHPLSSFD